MRSARTGKVVSQVIERRALGLDDDARQLAPMLLAAPSEAGEEREVQPRAA